MNLREPHFIHLAETTSTNEYLQKVCETEHLPSGSIVLADFQTAGRGQTGNSWESEAGKNLTFSILLNSIDVPANRTFVISEIASLSVKYTLDKYIPGVSVKWPNDVFCRDRKIAGILIQNTIMQTKITRSVIGIGINVNQTVFRSNAPNPVSMAQLTGCSSDIMLVMRNFQEIFAKQCVLLNNLDLEFIHNEYIKAIYRRDGYHKYRDANGIFEAAIHDIEPSGLLVLERPDGSRSKYAFKEVTYVRDAD